VALPPLGASLVEAEGVLCHPDLQGPLAALAGDLYVPTFSSAEAAKVWLALVLEVHGALLPVRRARWRAAQPKDPDGG
jgi:hypothetical protein